MSVSTSYAAPHCVEQQKVNGGLQEGTHVWDKRENLQVSETIKFTRVRYASFQSISDIRI